MEMRLYNSLARRVEPLAPSDGKQLRMYTCGLTVYDYGHIGNYRTFVAVDVLQRFLLSQGWSLNSVLNITDVDDKMIERAQAAGRSVAEHGAIYTQAFLDDLAQLDILAPGHLLKATDYVPQMVAWIERLVAGGHAYASDGSVYFRVSSFPAYGRLSGKDLNALQVGARVETDLYEKEEARDFVLWKAHKPGEPSWPSPWGPGRPGWHIECSVMSMQCLGESFDLHAGGTDLIFPHHENEIAQAEAVTGKPFVHCWMHVEFLLVNGEKMSKSLGNFYTLRDLTQRGFRPSAIRYLLASVPYRRQLNFTLEGLQQAAAAVDRLVTFRDRLRAASLAAGTEAELAEKIAVARAAFIASLVDNLNTAEALAAIFDLVREANVALDQGRFRAGNRDECQALLQLFDRVFAVLAIADREKMNLAPGLSEAAIEERLRERDGARQRRDFARADAIRAELEAADILVEDVKGGGVRWRRK